MSEEEKSMEGQRVLIVDDLEPNRLILEEIIKNMNCVPVLAESGQQALELVKKQLPHLVLTDISMPEMDGYELCRRLKSKEATRSIPIVFISAFDNPQDIVEGFRLGGADYITKPFIAELVQARVGVHLRLYETGFKLAEMNRRLQISVSEQLRQMEQEKKNILYALANIAAQNADYDKDYTGRLKRNCQILAQGMQLSPLFEDKISDTFIDAIELAAPLCDIGNIGVPAEILRKEGNLTQEETAALQKHTTIGAKLLSDLYVNNDYNDFINTSIDIARCHHESWDGSGYPSGMAGNEIPLAAQIVTVMAEYCRLTGKDNHSREAALDIMRGEAGQKFNADIFGICDKISRQLC